MAVHTGAGGRPVTVVGIGADGLDGLAPASRRLLETAPAVYGGPRQLELVRSLGVPTVPWPSPLLPALPGLVEEIADTGAVVLASGDPMFHGIGSTLARLVGPARLRVHPAPSSASLAAARMGWPLAGLEVHSCVTAHPSVVLRDAREGARCLVLCRDRTTPAALAAELRDAGLGASRLWVLSELGGPDEARHETTARELADRQTAGAEPGWADLCVVAVETASDPGEVPRDAAGPAPGLPDGAYVSDGQLTKSVQRAAAVSALRPAPGLLLWDVGGGTGTVGIEWMRCAPGARCVGVERDPARAEHIRLNARRLGVPGLEVVTGTAPDALRGRTERPDAVFVGGGATVDGLLDTCWDALLPGGRLVVAGVTAETEALLLDWRARHGGELTRLGVEHAEALGRYTGWRPDRTVVHLVCRKPHPAPGRERDHHQGEDHPA